MRIVYTHSLPSSFFTMSKNCDLITGVHFKYKCLIRVWHQNTGLLLSTGEWNHEQELRCTASCVLVTQMNGKIPDRSSWLWAIYSGTQTYVALLANTKGRGIRAKSRILGHCGRMTVFEFNRIVTSIKRYKQILVHNNVIVVMIYCTLSSL